MKRILLTVALALTATLGVAGVASAAPAPSGLTPATFGGRVELAWQPSAGATGYRVYRGTSADSVNVQLATIGANELSFVDHGVASGTEYFYVVRSIDGGGESADSRVVSASPPTQSCSSANVVVAENCLSNITQWKVANPSGIAGFATAPSVNRGESVDLKVNTGGAYDVEIVRTGYYGGVGGRQLGVIRNVPASAQPACGSEPSSGLLDCGNWSAGQRLTTTASWPSGVYMINLIPVAARGNTNTVLLVVRDDQRSSDLLYGVPDTTYQAYNDWGGRSLYAFNSTPDPQATKVSYNRPYAQSDPNLNQPNWYTTSDFPTVYWLEKSGYDVSYTAVSDLDRPGASLSSHRGFVSGAHDEYYSDGMRRVLEDGRNAKKHLFFTGANALYQKVRFENGGRTLVDFKTLETGIVDPSGPTGPWRDPSGPNRPENALLGAMYIGDLYPSGFYPLHVSAQQGHSRVWRHTGLDVQAPGATATVGQKLVGWEWDGRIQNGLEPAGLETVASSPVNGHILQGNGPTYMDGNATAEMTRYVAPSGAVVVNTATNHWNRGLVPANELINDGVTNGENLVQIRQATMNILADMRAAPGTPESDLVYDPPPPDLEPASGGGNPFTSPGGGGRGAGAGAGAAATVSGTIKARFKRSGRITKLKKLWATGVVRGSTIKIRCPKKKCGMRSASLRVAKSGTVQLTQLVKKRRLKPGTVLEAQILAGGQIGKVTRYTTKRKRKLQPGRSVLCLDPGAVKPGAC